MLSIIFWVDIFSFRTWNISFKALLSIKVSVKKKCRCYSGGPALIKWYDLSLSTFSPLSLLCAFTILAIICLVIFLNLYIWSSLWTCMDIFYSWFRIFAPMTLGELPPLPLLCSSSRPIIKRLGVFVIPQNSPNFYFYFF